MVNTELEEIKRRGRESLERLREINRQIDEYLRQAVRNLKIALIMLSLSIGCLAYTIIHKILTHSK